MRQKPSNKMPIHFYYVEYSPLEEIVVFVCFLLCLLFIAMFYAIESLYGNSGVIGVPFIAEVGVRYELLDPAIQKSIWIYK